MFFKLTLLPTFLTLVRENKEEAVSFQVRRSLESQHRESLMRKRMIISLGLKLVHM
jgi:hypothetical protein